MRVVCGYDGRTSCWENSRAEKLAATARSAHRIDAEFLSNPPTALPSAGKLSAGIRILDFFATDSQRIFKETLQHVKYLPLVTKFQGQRSQEMNSTFFT